MGIAVQEEAHEMVRGDTLAFAQFIAGGHGDGDEVSALGRILTKIWAMGRCAELIEWGWQRSAVRSVVGCCAAIGAKDARWPGKQKRRTSAVRRMAVVAGVRALGGSVLGALAGCLAIHRIPSSEKWPAHYLKRNYGEQG